MINILPEFESRQVLTSDELNWTACYLDTQNRQSRRFLIGCGLIGGLQVQLLNNSVQITNGIGLTSAGHIVSLSSNTAPFTTYTKFKKYTQKANEKLAFHYLSDVDLLQENYTNSVDNPSIYFPNFKGEITELFEETINDADPIDANTIKGKVAVLFAEIIQKELKDCEDDNCQERGKKYIFNSKVLIISKEDALLLLNIEYNIQTTSEDAISKLAFPWIHLPNINILKPAFSNSSVNVAFDENLIIQEYLRCIKDFITGITNNKNQIEEALKNIKNYCTSGNGSFVIIDQLIAQVNKSNILGNAIQPLYVYQIMYDYLWCFVKGYQELQAEAQLLKAKCFTNEPAFPNHVLLGIVDNQNADFDAAISNNHSIYRHNFQSRLVQSQQADISKNIVLFLNRLQTLAGNFDDSFPTDKKDIKLTTGGDLYKNLSWQAIPYYLKPIAATAWNRWSAQQNLQTYNTNYSSTNENQIPSANLSYRTLPSGFQGNHSFFRIEGAHGQTALNALNAVFQLRKKHGLAFEVLMLRMNEKAPFSNSFNFTINEDIESMYQVVRSEVLKQINLNVNYLWSLQIKTGKFNSIQTALSKELEKSYLFFLNNLNSTILAQPIVGMLSEAIMASNITSNFKAKFVTEDPKFQELEATVAQSKVVSNSYLKKEYSSMSFINSNFLIADIFKPSFDFQIGILFFNTLGNLVNSIKTSDKFKSTSDISFYSHFLAVVKAMQKNEKDKVLLLLALQLYCALKLQEEYLTDNFLELDIVKYKDNLEDELLPACNGVITYLKKLNLDFVRNDAILAEVVKGEMLDYADRIKFDDDWVKIIQLDAENKKRNGGVGVENLLERFVKLHPGMAHGCGVPKGGTYIMVYDTNNQIAADFYLPYIISSHLRPIQYTLVESKTLTLSGHVRDAAGAPIAATLLIGNATTATDKDGFYNVLVSENTTVKIVINAAGFANIEKEISIQAQSQILDVTMQAAEVKTFTTTLQFINQSGKPIKRDINLLNITANKTETAKNGALLVTDAPKKEYRFIVKDDTIEEKEFFVTIGEKDQQESVPVLEIDFYRIQIIDKSENGYTPSVLKKIKVVNPDMELDTSGLIQGFFITKEKADITKPATVNIIYKSQPKDQQILPGSKPTEVVFEAVVTDDNKSIPAVAAVTYPAIIRAKLTSIAIHKTKFALDNDSNIGKADMLTNGKIALGKEFTNAPSITIEKLETIAAAIFVIQSQIIIDKVDITATKSILTFNRSLKEEEIKRLATSRKEFEFIAKTTDLTKENFYCLILPPEEIVIFRRLLHV
jgi:hypothetical protein